MARQLAPCGTQAAYQRHRRHGEPPCDACVRANSQAHYRSTGARQRARIRAYGRLAALHPVAYAQLLDQEMAAERQARPAEGTETT